MIRKTIAAVVLGVTCAGMSVQAHIAPALLVGAGLGKGVVDKVKNFNMDDAKETARQYWNNAKQGAATGRDATVTFVKNHKKAVIAVVTTAAGATALVIAHKKGYLDGAETKATDLLKAAQEATMKGYARAYSRLAAGATLAKEGTVAQVSSAAAWLKALPSNSWAAAKNATTATGNGAKAAGSWVSDKAQNLWSGVKNVPSRVSQIKLPKFGFGKTEQVKNVDYVIITTQGDDPLAVS